MNNPNTLRAFMACRSLSPTRREEIRFACYSNSDHGKRRARVLLAMVAETHGADFDPEEVELKELAEELRKAFTY